MRPTALISVILSCVCMDAVAACDMRTAVTFDPRNELDGSEFTGQQARAVVYTHEFIREYGVDRPGGNLRNFDLQAGAEPSACEVACSRDPGCVAYTFVNAKVQGAHPRCWLKSTVANSRDNSCCVSGVRRSPQPGEAGQAVPAAPGPVQAVPAAPRRPVVEILSANAVKSTRFRLGEWVRVELRNLTPGPIFFLSGPLDRGFVITGEDLSVQRSDGTRWVTLPGSARIDEPEHECREIRPEEFVTRNLTQFPHRLGTYRLQLSYTTDRDGCRIDSASNPHNVIHSVPFEIVPVR